MLLLPLAQSCKVFESGVFGTQSRGDYSRRGSTWVIVWTWMAGQQPNPTRRQMANVSPWVMRFWRLLSMGKPGRALADNKFASNLFAVSDDDDRAE